MVFSWLSLLAYKNSQLVTNLAIEYVHSWLGGSRVVLRGVCSVVNLDRYFYDARLLLRAERWLIVRVRILASEVSIIFNSSNIKNNKLSYVVFVGLSPCINIEEYDGAS